MTKWAGDVLNWTKKDQDGLTPYHRVRGKPFTTRLVSCGESVQYKLRSHEPLINSPDGKRFHIGIFLGIDRRTGQYILHGDHGIKLARTIMRSPNDEKWNRERLQKLNVTPYSLHVYSEPEVIFPERDGPPPADLPERIILPKMCTSSRVILTNLD